jgi:type II secretory ATPase GspE/PulE/Tfp pilus assembly ATPase PilB-like protein
MASWTVRWVTAAIIATALLGGLGVRGAEPQAADGQPEAAAQPAAAGERPRMQEVDPNAPPPPAGEEEAEGFQRGRGGGLAIVPAVLWWLLVVGWAATTIWAGGDDGQPQSFTSVWLPILAFPFFVVGLAAWWIPLSAVACGLTAAAWLGTFLPYAALRDRPLPPDRRVLSVQNATLAAARGLQPVLRRMGIKLDLESRSLAASLPDVNIAAVTTEGGPPPEARLAEAQALEGFTGFRELVQRCMAMRVEQAVVEIGQQGATVKQLIDGTWQPLRRMVKRRIGLKVVDEWEDASQLDADEVKGLVAVVKTLCGVSSKSGKRQGGSFVVTLQKRSIPCRVALEKSDSGTRMRWEFQAPPPAFASLEALGFEEADAAKVRQALSLVNSLGVLSAASREGLTTTFAQVVLSADRLLRDFVILEDESAPFREIQNVKPSRWGGPDNRTPVAVLEEALRGYPTAIVVPHLNDGSLATALVKQAGEMLVIVGVQADDAVAAVENLLALGIPRPDLAKTLQVVTGQRLIRRVCPKCAEEYAPSADLLARLKVPAREGLAFKRAAAGGCPACSGTGYLGRAAIMELAGGPTTSKAIAASVDRATLVKAAQRDGMRRFRESGLAMVVAGITTLEELQRILKKEKGQSG